jgi:hypothetical protein
VGYKGRQPSLYDELGTLGWQFTGGCLVLAIVGAGIALLLFTGYSVLNGLNGWFSYRGVESGPAVTPTWSAPPTQGPVALFGSSLTLGTAETSTGVEPTTGEFKLASKEMICYALDVTLPAAARPATARFVLKVVRAASTGPVVVMEQDRGATFPTGHPMARLVGCQPLAEVTRHQVGKFSFQIWQNGRVVAQQGFSVVK